MSGAGPRARWAALLAEIAAPAFGSGEYVGQESMVTASEVRELARAAGIAAGTRVVDLCCGTAGPGALIAAETGCHLLGVDASVEAAVLARERADAWRCAARTAFAAGDALHAPLTQGFDAALLLETMLGIEDKTALLREVGRLLVPGGRFALTLEAGEPLTPAERGALPGGDVWFTPEAAFWALLTGAGFQVTWSRDLTMGHAALTWRLVEAYEGARGRIVAEMGESHWAQLVGQHRAFARWMDAGRLRKVAMVAQWGGQGRPGAAL